MDFSFSIPTPTPEVLTVMIATGTSAIFVGANGGGKTRLAVQLESELQASAHRISAHRSLSLNPAISKTSAAEALSGLRTGSTKYNIGLRDHNRWRKKAATHLLDDYDFLVRALFADQSNTTLLAYDTYKPGSELTAGEFKFTKFDQLIEIWRHLLPHRDLKVTGDDIKVQPTGGGTVYPASEMSDGERAIFYLIGQALVAAENQLLIIDEPELHVHRSIMSKLWDELEAARPDCAFVYITHDLEFAAARNAQKFVIREYTPVPAWNIETVPEDSGFPEELTTLILGSRQPILFVEGTETSLDLSIYRACYPDWTVVPRGSCNKVIDSVVSMRNNESLTRVTCSGIVDGDDYTQAEKDKLSDLGIQVLPVSEVENLLLLPSVTATIAEAEGHVGTEKHEKQAALAAAVFETLNDPQKIEDAVVKYCKRRIDRALKKVDLSEGRTLTELQITYRSATSELDICAIAAQRTSEIENAIADNNLAKLLEYYGNKGLLALAARHLKNCKRDQFMEWVIRSLRNATCPPLRDSLSDVLPKINSA